MGCCQGTVDVRLYILYYFKIYKSIFINNRKLVVFISMMNFQVVLIEKILIILLLNLIEHQKKY